MLIKGSLFFSVLMMCVGRLVAIEGQLPWLADLGDSIEEVRILEDDDIVGLTSVAGNEMIWIDREFKGMVGDLIYRFAPATHVFPGAEMILYMVDKEHIRALQRFVEQLLGKPEELVLVSGRTEADGSFVKVWNYGGRRYILVVSHNNSAHFMVRYPFAMSSSS
jgi:hypothetical protein